MTENVNIIFELSSKFLQYSPIKGVSKPMSGKRCEKYKRNIAMRIAMITFKKIFSPDNGGSQNVASVNKIITVAGEITTVSKMVERRSSSNVYVISTYGSGQHA